MSSRIFNENTNGEEREEQRNVLPRLRLQPGLQVRRNLRCEIHPNVHLHNSLERSRLRNYLEQEQRQRRARVVDENRPLPANERRNRPMQLPALTAAAPPNPPVDRPRPAMVAVPMNAVRAGINEAMASGQNLIRRVVHVTKPAALVAAPPELPALLASDAALPLARACIINNCAFVDMSRPAMRAQLVDVGHDHDYCSANMPPPLRRFAPSTRAPAAPSLGQRALLSISPHTLETIRVGDNAQQPYGVILDQAYGDVVDCYFVHYQLIVAQELRVSFYQQSGLGMFMESHSKWIPRGYTPRLFFDAHYMRKLARVSVLHSGDQGPAYLELYCKQHNYDSRKVPGCDLFVVLYYRSKADGIPKCKLHQLGKFTGYAQDVQYVVAPRLNQVTVYYEAWNGTTSSSMLRRNVSTYRFASDLQSIVEILDLQSPPHPITSLYIVEDCETMVVGTTCDMLTFWNGQYLLHTKQLPYEARHASFRCERGFIFVLMQPLLDHAPLCLAAINVSDFTHKVLQRYRPPDALKQLVFAVMLEGDVVAFYEEGNVCWTMESGRIITRSIHTGPAVRRCSWAYGVWLISVWVNRVYVHRMWKGMRRRPEVYLLTR